MEQQAVKYARPAPDDALSSVGIDERNRPDFQYRRVTTYNYSADELALMVDTIAMLKSLGSMMVVRTLFVAIVHSSR